MTDSLIVAVDGPAGSGKSSVSRGVARELGMDYLDTGAMYRAVTLGILRTGVDLADASAVADCADRLRIVSVTDPRAPRILLDGEDVSAEVRGAEVTAAVSAVSAVPRVRARLVDLQRTAAAASTGRGIVVEGRDIGTVVFPDADLKVFLTADAHARALRRAAEMESAVDAQVAEAVKADLLRRDAHDGGRAVSPLAKADDAVEVDSTGMTLDEVIAHVVSLVRTA